MNNCKDVIMNTCNKLFETSLKFFSSTCSSFFEWFKNNSFTASLKH